MQTRPDISAVRAQVAILGLGRMGRPMAANLVNAGFATAAWNRTPLHSTDVPAGVELARDAATALRGANVVILALTDEHAIDELLFASGIAGSLDRGAIVVDMGTSGPAAARRHAAMFEKLGAGYLDAPVSGGVKGAEAGRLAILVGGSASDFAGARPVLSALGNPHHLGSVGMGQTAKLANQIIVACSIAAIAEGLHFADAHGLDAATLIDALAGGFADSPILRQHGHRMARGDYEPGGTVRLHRKDLKLAADLDPSVFSRLTNAGEAAARFEQLADAGHGEADHAAYYLTYGSGDGE